MPKTFPRTKPIVVLGAIQILGLSLLLASCATSPSATPPSAQSGVRVHATNDLGDVRDQALRLASRYGPDRVLVTLDLDNTLLAMETELGADQWYDWQRELQSEDACDDRLVVDRLAVQGALYHLGAMRPTQVDVTAIVSSLAQAGIPTLVITARGKEFWLSTFRELRRNRLDFEDLAPGPPGGYPGTYLPEGASREVLYQDGIYMLAGQHKGNMLLELLDRIGQGRPDAVLFADDKAKNVSAVQEAMTTAGIHAEIYHYGREAARVAAFDEEQAARDWSQLAAAIQTVQGIMGDANFSVPLASPRDGCP